jgi:hypothetical protein
VVLAGGRNVGEAEDAVLELLDVDEGEIRGVDPVVEPFTAAGDHREQPEQVFVDQSVLEQSPAKRAAGADLRMSPPGCSFSLRTASTTSLSSRLAFHLTSVRVRDATSLRMVFIRTA